jgi:hypothetical protein
MEQAVSVDLTYGTGDRLHQPGPCPGRKGFRQSLLEGAARDVLKDQKEAAVSLTKIVKRHYVRMPNTRNRTRFAQPVPAGVRTCVGAECTREYLQGDRAIRSGFDRPVDYPHSAAAQLRHDLETSDVRESFPFSRHCCGSGVPTGAPLQDGLAIRAALDMLLDVGVRQITEGVGAQQA